MILHAGDFIAPFTAPFVKLGCKMIGVFGNNDGEKHYLREKSVPVGEIHDITAEFVGGGRNNCVLNEPYLVDALETSGLFDLIVDSHTHKLELRRESTLVVNPGEDGGWVTGRCTVGFVDLAGMD
ncbi:MAG: metallophosphoesterase family protein, partial [Armatimonadetes bacterium]|nr:metallophosphoesterase family protein [Armatimonadota bacterium]